MPTEPRGYSRTVGASLRELALMVALSAAFFWWHHDRGWPGSPELSFSQMGVGWAYCWLIGACLGRVCGRPICDPRWAPILRTPGSEPAPRRLVSTGFMSWALNWMGDHPWDLELPVRTTIHSRAA